MPPPDLSDLLERGAARPRTPGNVNEVWRRGQARRRRKRAAFAAGTVLGVVALVGLATTLWPRPSAPSIQQGPDEADAWGPLAVVPGSATGDEALIRGTLRVTERCVTLDEQGDDVLLVWPAEGTSWDPVARTIVFTNRDGTSIELRDGMWVTFGGGGDSTAEGGEPPQAWVQRIDWVSRPASECLTDTRWGVGEVVDANEVAADEPRWPASCPVTVPGESGFTPRSKAPEGPPSVYDVVWYGSSELWTMLDPEGEAWSDLPVGPDGSLTEKTFWWSDNYSPGDPGEFTVTAEHLDGSAPTVEASNPGGSGFNPFMLASTHESVTVVGLELPEPGCWELTADYKDATLSYVVWVDQ